MPGFVKTPKDEAKWAKAKTAASKSKNKDEGSFSDQDWALVNHIYHQMEKNDSVQSTDISSIDELQSFLEKARRRMYGETGEDDDEPEISEDQGFREFDPDQEEGSDADKWLEENDPEQKKDEDEYETNKEYDEYGDNEDEDAHQQDPEDDGEQEASSDEGTAPSAAAAGSQASRTDQEESKSQEKEVTSPTASKEGRFPQPSREDIAEMRQHTRPWEQNARDKKALEAAADKNPVLYHQGKMLEARNLSHRDRQAAYEEHKKSPEYVAAGPTKKMRLDAQFDKDWNANNPSHIADAMSAHSKAHEAGRGAKDIHAAAKDEQIRHVLTGGAQAEAPMSVEAGLQHAGGTRSEEGTQGSVTQDKASSFAAGNQDFLKQYAADYDKKVKKPVNLSDMGQYDEKSSADIQRVLGDPPALKDPQKKAKFNTFFEKYHPLIGMNAHRVLNKLGLDSRKGDIDLGMLHEAGMHGLMQAINDYDHEHPSKASFSTHASNKIRGLMQSALKSQDQIPQELRTGAKKFSQTKAAPVTQTTAPAAPKKDLNAIVSKHPPEVADRLTRTTTARQIHLPKATKPEGETE